MVGAMNLEQLLRAVHGGDNSALLPLSAMLLRELNRHFGRRGLAKTDVDDLTQSTIAVVLAELSEVPGDHPSLCGWVFTIARNRLLTHHHDKQRQLDTSLGHADDLAQPGRGPSSELRHREVRTVLAEEIEQMNEAWRVVIQNDLDGGDPNERAAEEGLTPSGWRTRRERGVGHLSERFEEIFEDSQ